MSVENPGKLWEFFSPTLWPPWRGRKMQVLWCIGCIKKFGHKSSREWCEVCSICAAEGR